MDFNKKAALTMFLAAFLLLTFSPVGNLKAQGNWGVGASAIYNFQSTGKGFGGRILIPISEKLYLVPQVCYFPGFNIIHEFFTGMSAQYHLITYGNLTGYVFAGGTANLWLNSESSSYKKAKGFNLIGDAGGGIIYGNRSLKPFAEQRYNPKWREGSLHIGLLWFPTSSGGKGKGRGKSSRHICPAYS